MATSVSSQRFVFNNPTTKYLNNCDASMTVKVWRTYDWGFPPERTVYSNIAVGDALNVKRGVGVIRMTVQIIVNGSVVYTGQPSATNSYGLFVCPIQAF